MRLWRFSGIGTSLYAAAKVSCNVLPFLRFEHNWWRADLNVRFHLLGNHGAWLSKGYFIAPLDKMYISVILDSIQLQQNIECFRNTADLTAWDAVLDLCCIIKLHAFLRKLQQAQESQAEPSSMKGTEQQQSNGGAELGSKVLPKRISRSAQLLHMKRITTSFLPFKGHQLVKGCTQNLHLIIAEIKDWWQLWYFCFWSIKCPMLQLQAMNKEISCAIDTTLQ